MERRDLEGLTRDELVAHAEAIGIPRPRTLTQAELIDEILLRTAQSEPERARVRGFLGRARDLLSRMVERGLHLPETAKSLRSMPAPDGWPSPPVPLPTITLAEIYAAQGYAERAIAVLDEVLAREPTQDEARQLRGRLVDLADRGARRSAEALREEAAAPAVAPGTAGEEAAAPAVAPGTAGEEAAAPAVAPGTAGEEVAAPAVAPRAHDGAAEEVTAVEVPARPDAAIERDQSSLPERYDVDEIVGMAVDPETLYLYWEIRPTTLARAQARRPQGQLVVRVVTVMPRWEGPVVRQRDLPIDALFGDMFVQDIWPGSDIRMSAGWLAADDFQPFAVGLAVSAPRVLAAAERLHTGTVVPAEPPPTMPAAAPEGSGHELRPRREAAAEPAQALPGAAASAEPVEPVGSAIAGAVISSGASMPVAPAFAASPVSSSARGAESGRLAPPLRIPEAPGRFPSGTVPTLVDIALSIAATRGGSSELARGRTASTSASLPVDVRSMLGPGESKVLLGGSSELWRTMDSVARLMPPPR